MSLSTFGYQTWTPRNWNFPQEARAMEGSVDAWHHGEQRFVSREEIYTTLVSC